jgi:hypothetical protein
MAEEGIERGFVDAGWKLGSGSSGYLNVGENGNRSILAHLWAWGPKIPYSNSPLRRGTLPTGSRDPDAPTGQVATRRVRRAA